MLANKNKIGGIGESLAVIYLKENKYKVVYQNINFSNQEVDIIAFKDNNYYIVEVKTSSYNSLSNAEDYINKKKLANLKKAAFLFSKKENVCLENIYFDLIAVKLSKNINNSEISHYRDIC